MLLARQISALTATSDEVAATIAACGKPLKATTVVSPEDGKRDKRLIYRDVTLHFRSVGDAWQFHLGEGAGFWILDRHEMSRKLPCFGKASPFVSERRR